MTPTPIVGLVVPAHGVREARQLLRESSDLLLTAARGVNGSLRVVPDAGIQHVSERLRVALAALAQLVEAGEPVAGEALQAIGEAQAEVVRWSEVRGRNGGV